MIRIPIPCSRRPPALPRPRRAATTLGLLLSLAVSGVAAGADEVGFVLEMRGQWVLEGVAPRALAEGDKLEAGTKVRPREPDAKAKKPALAPSLTVSLYTGEAAVYKGPATLPSRAPSTLPNRIWSLVSSRGMGGYVHPVSRAVGGDSVVRFDGESLDLTPIFVDPAPEECTLRFDRVGPGPGGEPVTLKVPKGATTCKANGLRPGLYDAAILVDEGREVGRTWLLLCPPPAFEQAAKTYAESVALSNAWDREISSRAVSRFRRACLASLAEHLDR